MTELRRGPSIGVSLWHGGRAARRPWHGGVRGGGGGGADSGEGGRKGKGAHPTGLLGAKRLNGSAGCWADWAES
jgi:hypothetical protein